MKQKQTLTLAAVGFAALVFGVIAGRLLAPASKQLTTTTDSPAHEAPAAVTLWTCSMHPQIRQPEPGKCPICGMDLIPVETGGMTDEGPRTLTMSDSAKALAKIQTTPVVRRFPNAEVRLVGKLDYDETRVKSLTARFPARIDELFVNYTGVGVKTGEHLARVYSPELLTAQRELLTAVRFDPNGSTARLAREKLRLWDLLPAQVDEIAASGEASDRFELRAPVGGIVVAKNVKEGDYVQTGQPMFRIADLSKLWLNLDAYESDLTWLRYGQEVTFEVEAVAGERFQGRIVFINPVLDPKTRTVAVRVDVPNDDGRLKPGMFVKAVVFSKVARSGKVFSPEYAGKWIGPMHPEIVKDGPGTCDICGMDLVPAESLGYVASADEEPPLVVPTSAVLRTGKRAVVYVAVPDRDKPTYEGREITIGPRAGDVFLVMDGLQEGDEVVTNGAFKIDSALQIQAKPSMMNPEGGGPAPGHDHGGVAEPRSEGPMSSDEGIDLQTGMLNALLPAYFELQSALAADDLDGGKAALQAMMQTAGHEGALSERLHAMLAAENLDGLRRPHFDVLSQVFITAVTANAESLDAAVYQMHCPMVYPDRGADWLQRHDEIRNPYFGAEMLTCGEPRGTWGGEEVQDAP